MCLIGAFRNQNFGVQAAGGCNGLLKSGVGTSRVLKTSKFRCQVGSRAQRITIGGIMSKHRPIIGEVVRLFRYGSPDERSWAGRWLRAHKAGLRSVATGAALRNIAAVNARRMNREQESPSPPLPADDAALVLEILKEAAAGISIDALNSRLLSTRGWGWGRVHAALTALLKTRRARDEYRSIAGGRLAHLWFAT